jgi:cytochrome P450
MNGIVYGGMMIARAYPFCEPKDLELDPIYADLLEHEPLSRIRPPYGDEAWLLVRYEDVETVLTDPRFSRAAIVTRDTPRLSPHKQGGGLLDTDPPELTRLRGLINRAFTTRRSERLRPRAQHVADELIDAMIATGPPADLIECFASPLPGTMICELLGVPYDDRDKFAGWGRVFMSATAADADDRLLAMSELGAYLADLIALRRNEPSDDLLSALVVAHDERDSLSGTELVAMAITLLAAGFESTASQIANSVLALLTEPDKWRLLHDKPQLVPDAVEELLRYVPLSASDITRPRYATEDVVLSTGTVHAGDAVVASIYAANRDPAVFDQPHQLCLDRRAARAHLAFGRGAHHCVGASLARTSLQVALGTLAHRMGGLRLAVTAEELSWKTGFVVRGPLRLPVAW